MQACQFAAQHGEARAGKLCAGVAIEPAVARAEFDVILDREIELPRRRPTCEFPCFASRPCRPARMHRQDSEYPSAIFASSACISASLCFVGFELVADAGDFGHQRGRVFALAFGHADRFRARIAQVLQFLRLDLHGLALRFERFDRVPCRVRSRAFSGVSATLSSCPRSKAGSSMTIPWKHQGRRELSRLGGIRRKPSWHDPKRSSKRSAAMRKRSQTQTRQRSEARPQPAEHHRGRQQQHADDEVVPAERCAGSGSRGTRSATSAFSDAFGRRQKHP